MSSTRVQNFEKISVIVYQHAKFEISTFSSWDGDGKGQIRPFAQIQSAQHELGIAIRSNIYKIQVI